ncbi:hypothetical protein SAY87_008210 [Trapa incisa]|uniref:Uncharacterized protein n=1 Tax=Trapa incisa TaxID=236973 RepID=A0AAN7KKY4_9MYRT|nr:hypothetical protein SAY87_008210 [Trapa incisa]
MKISVHGIRMSNYWNDRRIFTSKSNSGTKKRIDTDGGLRRRRIGCKPKENMTNWDGLTENGIGRRLNVTHSVG